MTGNGPNESLGPVSGATPSSDDSAQALRLRAERPRITRLSRKVLAGGTALALLLISGAVLWALRSNRPHNPAPDELYSTDHHNVADGLTTLPQDYAGIPRDVPRLGPPLPGDLGRPIVNGGRPISDRSVLTPNNNVPTRKPRRLGRAKYLRRPLRPLRHRMPHPRKRRPRLRHLLMKPSLRTGRIANSSSSMPRLIGGLQRLIGFHVLRHPLSCRRAQSFRRLSLQAFARIFPVKSLPKLPKTIYDSSDRACEAYSAGSAADRYL